MFELGRALLEMDQGGERELETAVEIWTDVHQRPHPKLAKAHMLLGRAGVVRGALDVAEQHARAMAAIQKQVLPQQHADRGEPESLLATVQSLRGNHASALVHARAALLFFELAGPHDPGAWYVRLLILDQLFALDRLDEAEAELAAMPAAPLADPDTAALVHLKGAELAVRRHRLEQADLHLQAVAAFGLDLEGQTFTYQFLRALVDLRLDRFESPQFAKPAPSEQLSAWFEQLELTKSELERLALDK
jgi:hypothetical protein